MGRANRNKYCASCVQWKPKLLFRRAVDALGFKNIVCGQCADQIEAEARVFRTAFKKGNAK